MTTHPLPPDFLREQVSIAVVGAGGNGSQMIGGLARLHMALRALGHPHGLHVTLYDPDTVSEANMGRQLFSPSDIGLHKATVLVNRVNCFFGLDWQACPQRFTNRYANEIIIGCVDSAASRRGIAKSLARDWKSYWLDLGNDARTGQVVLGQFRKRMGRKEQEKAADLAARKSCLPLVTELFPQLMDERRRESAAPSCSMAEALEKQDLFINQGVATFALNLLWTWFRHGAISHHGYFINLEAGVVRPLPIDPDAWQRMRDAGLNRKPKRSKRSARAPKADKRAYNQQRKAK